MEELQGEAGVSVTMVGMPVAGRCGVMNVPSPLGMAGHAILPGPRRGPSKLGHPVTRVPLGARLLLAGL